MKERNLWIAPLLFSLVYTHSSFAINKCIDSTGKVYYQDMECPANTKTEKINTLTEKKAISPQRTVDPEAFLADNIMLNNSESTTQAFIDVKLLSSELISQQGGDDAIACFDRYKPHYKDPASAYIIDSSIYKDKNLGETFVLVNTSARNGFGGASRLKLVCTLQKPIKSNVSK